MKPHAAGRDLERVPLRLTRRIARGDRRRHRKRGSRRAHAEGRKPFAHEFDPRGIRGGAHDAREYGTGRDAARAHDFDVDGLG